MSDNDELNETGDEAPEAAASQPKKKSPLASLLPTILKFAAIGLGAVIFIVTVSVITVRVMRGDGSAQTSTDPSSPYLGAQPILQWFSEPMRIQTQLRDERSTTVTAVIRIGFDQNDQTTASELFLRQNEMRDFLRRFFATRFAADLRPENEGRIAREIVETLNTRILSSARIRRITFDQLDIMEVF